MIMCKKRGYRDRIAAMVALATTTSRRSGRRNEVRVYRCPQCRQWHLSSRK